MLRCEAMSYPRVLLVCCHSLQTEFARSQPLRECLFTQERCSTSVAGFSSHCRFAGCWTPHSTGEASCVMLSGALLVPSGFGVLQGPTARSLRALSLVDTSFTWSDTDRRTYHRFAKVRRCFAHCSRSHCLSVSAEVPPGLAADTVVCLTRTAKDALSSEFVGRRLTRLWAHRRRRM